jgi:hypothetical protein
MNIDMADVKPTVLSLVVVTIMAIVGITLAKYIFSRWPVQGLSELVAAV